MCIGFAHGGNRWGSEEGGGMGGSVELDRPLSDTTSGNKHSFCMSRDESILDTNISLGLVSVSRSDF